MFGHTSAVLKWRQQYLISAEFVIRTYQKFAPPIDSRHSNTRTTEFLSKLLGFKSKLLGFKSGKTNQAVDTLSRLYESRSTSPHESLMAISFPNSLDILVLKGELKVNSHTKNIFR